MPFLLLEGPLQDKEEAETGETRRDFWQDVLAAARTYERINIFLALKEG